MSLPDSEPLGLYLAAAQWAVDAHDGQRRKSGQPYVLHPLRVASRILWSPLEVDERHTALIAAILHDTLEDTDLPRERIHDRFGKQVLSVVVELTQDPSLPKEARRQKMIDECGGYSRVAKVVKLADRWDNLTELENMSEEFITRYCREATQMVEAMRGTWLAAERAIEEIVEQQRGGGP